MLLSDSVETLDGVGLKRKAALSSLGITSIYDLLLHMPMRYEDRRRATPVDALVPGKPAVVRGTLTEVGRRKSQQRQNLWITTAMVRDTTGTVGVVWFGGWASDLGSCEGREVLLCGIPATGSHSLEFTSPEYKIIPEGLEGVSAREVEWNRIVPIYPTTESLPRKWLARIIFECVTSPSLSIEETLPEVLLRKRNLLPLGDALCGIHNPSSRQEIVNGRKSVVYREFFVLQKALMETRLRRCAVRAPLLAAGASALEGFLGRLPFVLTSSQSEVLGEIAAELDREFPMTRLLQGDVGSGKTVVALGAAAKALGAGYQVAMLAPTTILSGQLLAECEKNLAPLGFPCLELTGGAGAADKRKALALVREGKPFVLVGTHALLEETVAFGNLGLVVIDEQHRFGVTQRSSLREKDVRAHVLMMSATPIPRTLCLALYGDIDCSIVRGRPAGRLPVVTRIVDSRRTDEVYRYVQRQAASGGRCYWVCPSINGEGEGVVFRAEEMKRRLPDVRIAALHGAMPPDEKREIIARFQSGDVQAVVSTTVIEVGIDVAEANIIVVESASSFGLSQLHQLRGRVGRGTNRGVCLLLDDTGKKEASEKLGILERNDDGFVIAEADLRMRGEGDLIGLRQHGESGFRVADILKDAYLLAWAREDSVSSG